jgi:hypothetical protein
MDHLELIVQWIHETHKSFVRNGETRNVWEILVVREALVTPFLMHGILAISALHLSLVRNDGRKASWLSTAIIHKNAALKLFTQQLSHINPSNAKALMSFAGLVVAFAFGSSLSEVAGGDEPSLDALIYVFMLSRGLQTIVNDAGVFLRQSTFAPLLTLPMPTIVIPDSIAKVFDDLQELNNLCGRDSHHDTRTHEKMVRALQELSVYTYSQPTSMTLAAGWAIRATPDFLEYLQRREPLALVVLAHYCVFLHMAHDNWFIGSWGSCILKEIELALNKDWQVHIRWPLREVFGASDSQSAEERSTGPV